MIPYEREEGEYIIDEMNIQSISYLFGFYINSNEDSIIKVGWAHILFFLLICGDIYAQQLDNYFINKIKINRKQYRNLSFKLKKIYSREKKEEEIIPKRNSVYRRKEPKEKKGKLQISDINSKENKVNKVEKINIKGNPFTEGSNEYIKELYNFDENKMIN